MELRPVELRGANRDLLLCDAPRVLAHGPTGTGKSFATQFKVHAMCELNPGSRWIFVRAKRVDLNISTISEYRDMLGPGHPAYTDAQASSIQSFRYPNRSEVWFLGLDEPSRLKGPSLDGAVFEEATVKIRPGDIAPIATRIRHDAGPYTQMIFVTNPGAPTHWLLNESKQEGWANLASKLEDNPYYHDGTDWTPAGLSYRKQLMFLRGSNYQRDVEGIWAAAEGAVFDDLSVKRNAFSPSETWGRGYPDLPCYVGLDWGIADPFCAVLVMVDRDNKTAYVLRECYERNLSTKAQAERVRRMIEGFNVRGIYYDPSMESSGSRGASGIAGESPILAFEEMFGGKMALTPGINRPRLAGIDAIRNAISQVGEWSLKIDPVTCPNGWSELAGAVWAQDMRGGYVEDIDPVCPDHFITALYYFLRTFGLDMRGSAPAPPQGMAFNPLKVPAGGIRF